MHCAWLEMVTTCTALYDCLDCIGGMLLMDRQRRFTFPEAPKHLQIASADIDDNSDAEATSNSETESIADDGELPLEVELSDIDVFEEENENDGSDEDQEPNDDHYSSIDDDQIAITAGNATYYDSPSSSKQRRRNILTQQPRIIAAPEVEDYCFMFPIHPIHPDVWETFNSNLRNTYIPNKASTVNKQLVGYRGKIPGRTCLPSKPRKYVVKFFWLKEATSGFASNGMIYSGRESDSGPHRNLTNDFVMKLCSVYFGTGRDIYVDRYFTSHGLVCNPFQQNLTLIGQLWLIGVKYHRSSKQQREERLNAPRHCMIILTKFFYCHTSPNAT